MADKVAFVDNHKVNVAHLLSLGPNRLNACKRNRFIELLAPYAGTVNAHRRTWPMLAKLFGVLLDKFLNVRKHEDARLRPFLHCLLTKRRHDVRLTRSGREDKAGIAGLVLAEPIVKLVNGSALIVTEHHPITSASGKCSRTSSRMPDAQASGLATISRLL